MTWPMTHVYRKSNYIISNPNPSNMVDTIILIHLTNSFGSNATFLFRPL